MAQESPQAGAPDKEDTAEDTKRRKSTVKACLACRRMKKRCGHEKPCLRCVRNNRECVSPGGTPYVASGTPRNRKRKRNEDSSPVTPENDSASGVEDGIHGMDHQPFSSLGLHPNLFEEDEPERDTRGTQNDLANNILPRAPRFNDGQQRQLWAAMQQYPATNTTTANLGALPLSNSGVVLSNQNTAFHSGLLAHRLSNNPNASNTTTDATSYQYAGNVTGNASSFSSNPHNAPLPNPQNLHGMLLDYASGARRGSPLGLTLGDVQDLEQQHLQQQQWELSPLSSGSSVDRGQRQHMYLHVPHSFAHINVSPMASNQSGTPMLQHSFVNVLNTSPLIESGAGSPLVSQLNSTTASSHAHREIDRILEEFLYREMEHQQKLSTQTTTTTTTATPPPTINIPPPTISTSTATPPPSSITGNAPTSTNDKIQNLITTDNPLLLNFQSSDVAVVMMRFSQSTHGKPRIISCNAKAEQIFGQRMSELQRGSFDEYYAFGLDPPGKELAEYVSLIHKFIAVRSDSAVRTVRIRDTFYREELFVKEGIFFVQYFATDCWNNVLHVSKQGIPIIRMDRTVEVRSVSDLTEETVKKCVAKQYYQIYTLEKTMNAELTAMGSRNIH